MRAKKLLSAILLLTVLSQVAAAQDRLGVQRKKFTSGTRYLLIEILDDDLAHFELSENGAGSSEADPVYVTPMIHAEAYKAYPGPLAAGFSVAGNIIETTELKLTVDADVSGVTVFDKVRGVTLTRIHGEDLHRPTKRLVIDRVDMQNAYGVGNLFHDPGTADGDWIGRQWIPRNHGNFRFGFYVTDSGVGSDNFHGGGPSVSQFPILYAIGPEVSGKGFQNYALLLDQVYRVGWDLREDRKWLATMWGDQIRWFVCSGPDLKDLRGDVMELIGRPPVPPRSTFGLWISEFGYDNWDEIDTDLDSLASNRFPVDGVALDIQWFGGSFDSNEGDAVCEPNRMGTLEFSTLNFPDAATRVPKYLKERAIRFMTIEESFVDNRLPIHGTLKTNEHLARVTDGSDDTVVVTRDFRKEGEEDHCVWWGRGGMIDWTNPAAGKFWHDNKRSKLALLGITSHWLDLGEPEMYYQDAIYHGFPELGKNRHGDIHNVYNLLWSKSIATGYEDPAHRAALKSALGLHQAPRHFTLSRAGTIGSQRYGGMWSGDVGQNLGNLRAHLNTQLHMSLAGMDYYTSDAGGFSGTNGVGHEEGHDSDELYTQWFANNSLLDIPLRPHAWTNNELSGNIRIAPDQRGHKESNRANLVQRYELSPYLYSLAYRAHLHGEPIFPPLVYHFQQDPHVRRIGNVKMIGGSLLFGVVAGFGQTDRPVYLPPGAWINCHTNEWFDSTGVETAEIPVYRDRGSEQGLFTPPLFARAGAIVPLMYVDDKTMNISGRRRVDLTALSDAERALELTKRTELRLKIYAASDETEFTVYEDDGATIDYRAGIFRKIKVSQKSTDTQTTVKIHPAEGSYRDAPTDRGAMIAVVVRDRKATGVRIDGADLAELASLNEFQAGKVGWVNASRNLILARIAAKDVADDRTLDVQLSAELPKTSSVHFVCSNGKTEPGEAIYVLGNIAELGAWDPAKAIRLTPVRYPKWYRWSVTVPGLPASTELEWKFIRRKESGGPPLAWDVEGPNHRVTTASSGFTGTTRTRFAD